MFHAADLIRKKRDGEKLSYEELEFLIQGYVQGKIPDYQMAAWNMAVYFQGMEPEEITNLTLLMAHSGTMLDLRAIKGVKVDKHSTGGVGDTTTLIVAPLVASLGVPVAKMSGRGLGHTGGTVDKLESIPGYKVNLDPEQFISQVNEIGVSVVGQTGELAPADKLLYSLRDVTATVESIPLIASSIMSKKIAAGADGFVLDVKMGTGAFMKSEAAATELAKTMVQIGTLAKRETVALVTDMNQPLGRGIGNALEVKEAILTLQGYGHQRLIELCLSLTAEMLLLAKVTKEYSEARRLAEENLRNKKALQKLAELIQAQGGNVNVVEDLTLLPQASYRQEILAPSSGYIQKINPLTIGTVAMELGAGRETKDSMIDLAVGLELKVEVGDYIQKGQSVATVYANSEQHLTNALRKGWQAFTLSEGNIAKTPTIYKKITVKDV